MRYEVFQQLLTAKGCTAYRVSKETGIPTATLSAWKQGKYAPKKATVQKIADYFGVDIAVFYADAPSIAQKAPDNPLVWELLEEAKKANSDDLKAVLSMLKRLNAYSKLIKGE